VGCRMGTAQQQHRIRRVSTAIPTAILHSRWHDCGLVYRVSIVLSRHLMEWAIFLHVRRRPYQ
jgi:hypothetical protein